MIKHPKISVIIPSYNQGEFLEETILSILTQNYPSLELIIIDGGSSDCTIDIIKKYTEFIFYWVSEKDRGQSHAINKGLDIASGEYISFLNSDDCYLPGYLNAVAKQVIKSRKKIDFIYGNVGLVGSEIKNALLFKSRKISTFAVQNLLRFFYSVDYIVPSQSVLMHRDLVRKVKYFKEDLHYCMDIDYYVRCALQKPIYQVYTQPSYFFRINEFTKTSTQKIKMYEEAIMLVEIYKYRLSILQKFNLERLAAFENQFRQIREYNEYLISVKKLLKLLVLSPIHSLYDRRYLGLWKRLFLDLSRDILS